MNTGFLPDRHLTPWTHHRALIGAALQTGDMPQQTTASQYIDATGGINDQSFNEAAGLTGEAESCVGWYLAEAVGTRALGLGYKGDAAFAGGFPYTAARKLGQRLDGEPDTDPLDAGTAPSLAVDAVRRAGLPTKAACPYTGPRLSMSGFADGADKAAWIISGYAGIAEVPGPDLTNAINQAMMLPGMTVGLAIFASNAFKQADGRRVLSARDFAGGMPDHMISLANRVTVLAVGGGIALFSDGTSLPCDSNLRVGDSGYLARNHWSDRWAIGCPERPGTVYVDQYGVFQAGFIGLIEISLTEAA